MQEFEDQQQDTPDTIDNIYTPDHWRVQEDQARNIISHGQSLLWAIDSTTQENQDDTAS